MMFVPRRNKKAFAVVLLVLLLLTAILTLQLAFKEPTKVEANPSYEDFTGVGWTEDDETDGNGNYLRVVNATHINFTCSRNKNTTLYKSYGSAYFGDFVHYVDGRPVTNDTTGSNYPMLTFWGLSNYTINWQAHRTMNYRGVYAFFEHNGKKFRIREEEDDGSPVTITSTNTFTYGNWYYFKINKTASTTTLLVYTSQANRESDTPLEKLTLDLGVDYKYEYLLPANSFNTGEDAYMQGWIRNLDIGLDIEPPIASNVYTNTTIAGTPANLTCKWTDSSDLDWAGLMHNNTGTWSVSNETLWGGQGVANYTSPKWANKTLTLNSTIGQVIGVKWFCNDTVGNMALYWQNITTTSNAFWEILVYDSRRGWDALLELRNDFNPSYGNLTHRYYKEGLDSSLCPAGTNVTTYHLYPDLLPASLAMYKLTGNETYLDYARSTCDDMVDYMMQGDGQVCYFKNSTGSIDGGVGTSFNLEFLPSVAWLAMINSSYVSVLTDMADYVLDNHVVPSTKFVYTALYPSEVVSNDQSGIYGHMQNFATGMMYAYLVSGDSDYLDAVYDLIEANWDERSAVDLLWDQLEADNPSNHYETMTRQYSSGGWLRNLAMYYYITGNNTVKDILENFSRACVTHFWDGDNWDYRLNVADGTPAYPDIEGNWASLDYGVLLAYDIIGNETYLDYVKENHNTTFNDEGYGVHTSYELVSHASSEGGGISGTSDESATNFAFSMINLIGQYFGHTENSSDYWSQLYTLYKNTLLKAWEAESGKYGYSRMIKLASGASQYQTETDPAGRSNRDPQATQEIVNWASFWIRPTSGVNITWLTLGDTELYSPTWGTMYGAHQYWNNVTFNYQNKTMLFDKITGSGSVTFNETIQGARRDGASYSNYSETILNVTNGSHSYTIYFGDVPPPEGEIRFAILNDVHLGSSGENYTTVATTIANLYTKYGQLDFIIIGQDAIHQVSDPNYILFRDYILSKMEGGTFPIFWRGNHESDSNNNYGRWWNETSLFPDRWAFKYKDVLFIGIPTGGWGGDSVEWDANYQFVKFECESNPSKTTIIFTPEALWNTTDAPTGQNSTGETGYVISSRYDVHERLVFKQFVNANPQIKLFVHAQNHVNDAQNNGTYEGVWVFGLSGKDFGGSTIPGTEIVKVNATSIGIQICNGLTGEDIGWGRNFFLSTTTSFNPNATNNYFSHGALIHDNDKRQIWSQFLTPSGNVTLELIGLYPNSTVNILPDPDIQWCHWTAEDDIFIPYVGIEGAARWENWTEGSVLVFRRTVATGNIDLVCPIRRVSDAYAYLTEWLPFTNGSTYELEIECKANQTRTNCLGFEVKWHGIPPTWGTETNNTAYTVTTSYQNFTGRITAPANALSGQFKFTFGNCSEDTLFYVDRMTVKIMGQTHDVTEGANVTINGVTYGASGNLTGYQSNSYQVPMDFGTTWMRAHCAGSKMFMYRIVAENPQFFVMNKAIYQDGDDWNTTSYVHSNIYNFSYVIGINLTNPQFKLMNGTGITRFTIPTWDGAILECNVTGTGTTNYVVYCANEGNATEVLVDGIPISFTYNVTWEGIAFNVTLASTKQMIINWGATLAFNASLTVNTVTHSWTINPGQSNVTIIEGTINITVSANKAYSIQVKGDGNLTHTELSGETIDLSNVLFHKDTLASADAMTTAYQDVGGLTNQTAGTDVELTFKLWLTVPVGTRAGDYTYTLYIQIVEYS